MKRLLATAALAVTASTAGAVPVQYDYRAVADTGPSEYLTGSIWIDPGLVHGGLAGKSVEYYPYLGRDDPGKVRNGHALVAYDFDHIPGDPYGWDYTVFSFDFDHDLNVADYRIESWCMRGVDCGDSGWTTSKLYGSNSFVQTDHSTWETVWDAEPGVWTMADVTGVLPSGLPNRYLPHSSEVAPVPLPASGMMLLVGVAGLAWRKLAG